MRGRREDCVVDEAATCLCSPICEICGLTVDTDWDEHGPGAADSERGLGMSGPGGMSASDVRERSGQAYRAAAPGFDLVRSRGGNQRHKPDHQT